MSEWVFGSKKTKKKNRNNKRGYFIRQLTICSSQIMLKFIKLFLTLSLSCLVIHVLKSNPLFCHINMRSIDCIIACNGLHWHQLYSFNKCVWWHLQNRHTESMYYSTLVHEFVYDTVRVGQISANYTYVSNLKNRAIAEYIVNYCSSLQNQCWVLFWQYLSNCKKR